jgi:hypothetical protein
MPFLFYNAVFNDLYAQDALYADKLIDFIHYERYDERFMTCSECFAKNLPGFVFSKDLRVVTGYRKTVNAK